MCLGHESSGVIVQLGSNVAAKAAAAGKAAAELASSGASKGAAAAAVGARALNLGDKVTLEPGTTCRMCTDCRSGCYQVSRLLGPWLPNGLTDAQICEHMAFAAYPPFDGTLQRYYKL